MKSIEFCSWNLFRTLFLYFPNTWPRLFRMLPKRPFLLSFALTCSKHLSHKDLKFDGLLSFNAPLMCSKKGPLLPLSFTEHFWHLWCDLSNTVCRILSVKISYFFLSMLPVSPPPKNDNDWVYHRARNNSCYQIFKEYLKRITISSKKQLLDITSNTLDSNDKVNQ